MVIGPMKHHQGRGRLCSLGREKVAHQDLARCGATLSSRASLRAGSLRMGFPGDGSDRSSSRPTGGEPVGAGNSSPNISTSAVLALKIRRPRCTVSRPVTDGASMDKYGSASQPAKRRLFTRSLSTRRGFGSPLILNKASHRVGLCKSSRAKNQFMSDNMSRICCPAAAFEFIAWDFASLIELS